MKCKLFLHAIALFGMVHLIPWMMFYRKIIQSMYTFFKQSLFSSVEDLGLVHLGTYVDELINSNENLSKEEKDKILNIYILKTLQTLINVSRDSFS